MKKKSGLGRNVLFALWLIFTVSLTGWWFVFAARLVDRIALLEGSHGGGVARLHSMLVWEGAVLVLSLVAGAAGLGFLSFREIKSREALKRFFATFTHELKTPLTSLRLQAETLKEQITEDKNRLLLERHVSYTERLSLQLENSLWLAGSGTKSFLIEDVLVGDRLAVFGSAWPGLSLLINGEAKVRADRRAMESIFQNLIQNACAHGLASKVTVDLSSAGGGFVRIAVKDNGKGFAGKIEMLGTLFERHNSTSGSGIGLYIVKDLVAALGGSVVFSSLTDGFLVEIRLPGEILQ